LTEPKLSPADIKKLENAEATAVDGQPIHHLPERASVVLLISANNKVLSVVKRAMTEKGTLLIGT